MTIVKDSLSSKQGKNRLKNKSNKLVTTTLRLLDELVRIANESNDKNDIAKALQAHLELMPFIRPKLQAISPAELDESGGLTAVQVRHYADVLERAQQEQLDEVEQYRLSQGIANGNTGPAPGGLTEGEALIEVDGAQTRDRGAQVDTLEGKDALPTDTVATGTDPTGTTE
ncbi:MAG: hypothetical protein KKB31_07880 [Nanoarchaeota archaeon]|nr:hypothetical protein [Nanoarchaeota archaeon]